MMHLADLQSLLKQYIFYVYVSWCLQHSVEGMYKALSKGRFKTQSRLRRQKVC